MTWIDVALVAIGVIGGIYTLGLVVWLAAIWWMSKNA